jgi:hypothetical protein
MFRDTVRDLIPIGCDKAPDTVFECYVIENRAASGESEPCANALEQVRKAALVHLLHRGGIGDVTADMGASRANICGDRGRQLCLNRELHDTTGTSRGKTFSSYDSVHGNVHQIHEAEGDRASTHSVWGFSMIEGLEDISLEELSTPCCRK